MVVVLLLHVGVKGELQVAMGSGLSTSEIVLKNDPEEAITP